jgi:hypothetical protein
MPRDLTTEDVGPDDDLAQAFLTLLDEVKSQNRLASEAAATARDTLMAVQAAQNAMQAEAVRLTAKTDATLAEAKTHLAEARDLASRLHPKKSLLGDGIAVLQWIAIGLVSFGWVMAILILIVKGPFTVSWP